MGQLELRDKTEIEQRLKFSLGLSSITTDEVKPRRELEERGNKASTTDGY
jgi:hypothetical protein